MSRADPYQILGVKRDATQDEIQKAYRRLAKKLHPDLNPGNREAEAQFKEVSAAYDLLSDPERRARFDRGEIDASGAERPHHRFYRDFADGEAASHPYASDAGFADFVQGDDLFSELFGRGGRFHVRMRGADARYRLPIDFLDAVNGATKRLTLSDKQILDVTIPPGTRDGDILRLPGRGLPGRGGGPSGDALIEVEVRPHAYFKRKGDDIHIELPVSLAEAVLGARIKVPTPTGPVTMKVPKGTNTGTVLRLTGKGVRRPDGSRGDEHVTVKVVLPESPDPQLESFVSNWPAGKDHNPRRAMESQA